MLRLMAAKLSRHWPSRQACASPLVLMSSSQVSGMIACEPRRPADSTSWPSRAKSRKVAQKPPVQRGAPLAPVRTIAMGAFASAALGDVGLQLFHAQDESLAVFVWQLGSALLLSWLAARAGHLILKWPTERLRKRLLFDQPPL